MDSTSSAIRAELHSLAPEKNIFFEEDRKKINQSLGRIINEARKFTPVVGGEHFIDDFIHPDFKVEDFNDPQFSLEDIASRSEFLATPYREIVEECYKLVNAKAEIKEDDLVNQIIDKLYLLTNSGDVLAGVHGTPKVVSYVHNVIKNKELINSPEKAFLINSVFVSMLYTQYLCLNKETVLNRTQMGREIKNSSNLQSFDGFDVIRHGLAKIVNNLANRKF